MAKIENRNLCSSKEILVAFADQYVIGNKNAFSSYKTVRLVQK